jgi:crotonobetainyl-CoA:carnitine CoA-transferase CaiB-like acyl-CoA transferase
VPSATFRCKDGKYAHITASDQHWAPLCKALGIEEWGWPFSTNAIRVERRDEVMATLTENRKIERLTASMLDEVDVPVGPVNDVAEILSDPHVRARGWSAASTIRASANSRRSRMPYKFLGWDNPEIGRPPTLGEHTERARSFSAAGASS